MVMEEKSDKERCEFHLQKLDSLFDKIRERHPELSETEAVLENIRRATLGVGYSLHLHAKDHEDLSYRECGQMAHFLHEVAVWIHGKMVAIEAQRLNGE